MKCQIAFFTLLCNVLGILHPTHAIMGMFNNQRNQPQQHNPIWVPPRICIQRVPVPQPFPVQVPVPFKVIERVEVKVPVPVKVKEPFLVKVPILVPFPEKKETSTPPPPPPPAPVFIRPPSPPTPFIFHNYITEPEPKIYTVMPRGMYHRNVHYDANTHQQRESDDSQITDSHPEVSAKWHKSGYRIRPDHSPVIPTSLVSHQHTSDLDGHRAHHLTSASTNFRSIRGNL